MRATGWARVACAQMRVAVITDNRVVQVRYIKTHVRNTRRILRPEVVRTELQDPDTQLTLPSSPSNLLEAIRSIDHLHFGLAIVIVFPVAQLSTSRTWKFLLELVELGLAIFR